MGGNVLKKLRSSKGASITFALLAFLVCAVISAVLLASASAASGRASDLADSDRRYYAVTSAAQLFCDSLDGQEFTIERVWTKNDVKATKYETGSDGSVVGSSTTPDVDIKLEWFDFKMTEVLESGPRILVSTTDKDQESSDTVTPAAISLARHDCLLAGAALSYVLGTPTKNIDETVNELNVAKAYNVKRLGPDFAAAPPMGGGEAEDDKAEIKIGEFSLVFPEAYTGPAVTATVKMRSDASIVIEFKNDDETKPFSVTVTLTATVVDNSTLPITNTSENTSLSIGTDTYTETIITTTVKTKMTSIKWKVTDIKKGAA